MSKPTLSPILIVIISSFIRREYNLFADNPRNSVIYETKQKAIVLSWMHERGKKVIKIPLICDNL